MIDTEDPEELREEADALDERADQAHEEALELRATADAIEDEEEDDDLSGFAAPLT